MHFFFLFLDLDMVLMSLPTFDKVSESVACENIRFSSLFTAGDVSRGGTSVTQRQKFHTDDCKSMFT